MTEPYELKEETERLILVGVQEQAGDDTEDSVYELGELVQTAGAEVVGTMIQRRERIHPGTYIGKGKIEEVRMMADALEATGIVCDDELSLAQMNNLQQELNLKVMDRTLVILDIFARHAVTSEGKIQVELAQLRYRAAHLKGLFPGWAAGSEPADPERKNWKWTAGGFMTGSDSSKESWRKW